MDDNASPGAPAVDLAPRLHTVRCTLLPVQTQQQLTSSQAAALIISIIQHLVVQLRLTADSWPSLEAAEHHLLVAQAADPSRHASPKARQFLVMMASLKDQFRAVEHVFEAAHGRGVKEVLLVFGTSARSPAMIYRVHLAYDCTAVPVDGGSASASDAVTQQLRRQVMRQLIGFAEQLYPEKLPAVMRSQSLRLNVLFRLDSHPVAPAADVDGQQLAFLSLDRGC